MDRIVGSRKREETGSVLPKARFTSATNFIASNEFPPSIKKSSSTSIGDVFRIFCQISTSLPSTRSNGLLALVLVLDPMSVVSRAGRQMSRLWVDELAIDPRASDDVFGWRVFADTSPTPFISCISERRWWL